jgi:GTP pyrophosphokinase
MVTRKNVFYSDLEGNIDIESWLNHVALYRPQSRLRLIKHAIALSQLTSVQKETPIGTSCLQQGLVMADILLDLMLDEDTICAAILYNTVCYADLDLRIIEEQINSNVTKLLRGALRMDNISHFLELKNLKQNQVEKFRKMLFSMAEDMRVVLLKLAERVAWMRGLKQRDVRTLATRHYARETLTIYASLANRLGIHAVRYELEDLAMEQLAPRLYRKMTALFQEPLMARESYIKELALAIEITLPQVGIQDFKIYSRVKNFYGTYRKMQHKRASFQDIYDLNAIRIVVNTVKECYQAVEVIRTLWNPVPDGFDDYIQSPKENNYRSIHLAVYGDKNKIIEIQVRTSQMDQESEHGLAAHWEYKEDVVQKPGYHTKIAWLRQVLTWQKELIKNGIYLMPELTATLSDRVYVLTQLGDIIDLPKGSTALDFAYHVNTEMGHYCHQVIVDGVSKPLTYVLNTGEQIEIFTGKQLALSWDWLNPDLGYLHTAQAKAKVLHWFQQKEYYQHIVMGQLLLEKGCRQLGIQFIDQAKLAHEIGFQSKKELLAALGSGELRIVQVLHALHTYSKQKEYNIALLKPTTMLSTRESLLPYEQSRVNHTKIVEIQMVAEATPDIMRKILTAAHKQCINLFTISAVYQANEKQTHIILQCHEDTKEKMELFIKRLQRLKTMISVVSSLS